MNKSNKSNKKTIRRLKNTYKKRRTSTRRTARITRRKNSNRRMTNRRMTKRKNSNRRITNRRKLNRKKLAGGYLERCCKKLDFFELDVYTKLDPNLKITNNQIVDSVLYKKFNEKINNKKKDIRNQMLNEEIFEFGNNTYFLNYIYNSFIKLKNFIRIYEYYNNLNKINYNNYKKFMTEKEFEELLNKIKKFLNNQIIKTIYFITELHLSILKKIISKYKTNIEQYHTIDPRILIQNEIQNLILKNELENMKSTIIQAEKTLKDSIENKKSIENQINEQKTKLINFSKSAIDKIEATNKNLQNKADKDIKLYEKHLAVQKNTFKRLIELGYETFIIEQFDEIKRTLIDTYYYIIQKIPELHQLIYN